jgi:DNA-directed RNA polymerase subunit RPC12/RpoP
MRHLKCVTCRTRFHTDDRRLSDVREDRCPRCNSPLESPSRLTELVGFQRSRFDGLLSDADTEFLAAVAMALTPPGTER